MYRAQAIYQFDGAVPTDLPLKEGEIVTIIGKLPGNLWWEGESADGRIGTFPYNYVTELPPEEEFRDFVGKTGISNFDIIQFVTNNQDNLNGKLSILCHVISGDGEYITEMFHEDFFNLDLIIKEHFPLLDLPSLPTTDAAREVYKKLIHDYFLYFCIHQMVTPVILKWLQSIPKICVSPCPHWKVTIHTTNLISDEEQEIGGKSIISVSRGEHYILHDIEDDYLQLEGEDKEGWCSLRYCEIEWSDNFTDPTTSQLKRIIPFSLPSIQCSDDLRINHITMQTLLMCDRFGPQPMEGDTVMLQMQVYIWNSLRGYMYQFYNTTNPVFHVIGQPDNSIITELIDHKLQLMRQGEKTMIILHSSTDAPKEISTFLEGCISFYLCYVIDLRAVKKEGDEHIVQQVLDQANKKNEKPVKPAKPANLFKELAMSTDLFTDNVELVEIQNSGRIIPVVELVPEHSEVTASIEIEIVSEHSTTGTPLGENDHLASKDLAVATPRSPSSKPPLPPKPKLPKDSLSTRKGSRPELPPKPAHLSKSVYSLIPPMKPPKPSRLAKQANLVKLVKPTKPVKPNRATPVTSSDSHEGYQKSERFLSSSTGSV